MSKYLALAAILLLPAMVHAAVGIHEIAWMGTSVDNGSYCEWVELANTGTESVSLTGWTLKTLDAGMNVSLTGSISAGGFYLIERATPSACPDPVPGVAADLSQTFGSGLSNAGEILILSSSAGEIERIDASGGWEGSVGGEVDRKLTAQRNGDVWVTAYATPRATNATESVAASSSSSSTSSSGTTSTAGNPIPTLIIDTEGDRTVSTKAHTTYRAIVYDSTGRHIRNPHLSWTFGDGERSEGIEVEHMYREPGEYLVVVRSQEEYSKGVTSFVVTADPADISISALSQTGVTLTNNDTRILDLSLHRLASEWKTFRIPKDTQILPGRSVVFSPDVTGIATTTQAVSLLYPNGKVAFSYPTTTPVVHPTVPEVSSSVGEQATVLSEAFIEEQPLSSLTDRLVSMAQAFWPKSISYRRLSHNSL